METVSKKKPRSKKNVLIISFLGVLVGATAAVIVLMFFYKPDVKQDQGFDSYAEQVDELEKRQAPSGPLEKAIFYGQLGFAYQENKNYDKALENYLIAQDTVDTNNLSNVYAFYLSIADAYAAKGNKPKEKTYLEKQLEFLKAIRQQHPDDGGAADEGIKMLEERIAKL